MRGLLEEIQQSLSWSASSLDSGCLVDEVVDSLNDGVKNTACVSSVELIRGFSAKNFVTQEELGVELQPELQVLDI